MVDISIVTERPAGRQPRRERKRERERQEREKGEREKGGGVKALSAVVRVCLFCGHLLPATPGGWPCPSVFGERLSFDRRQTARRPKRAPWRSFHRWIRSATLPMGEFPLLFLRFLVHTFLIDITQVEVSDECGSWNYSNLDICRNFWILRSMRQ